MIRSFKSSVIACCISLLALSACGMPAKQAQIKTDADMWRAYEASLIAKGKLKTERIPIEAPFSNADLVNTFREIMFFDEFVREETGYRAARVERRLEKRTGPVRYSIWGSGVTQKDRDDLQDVVRRIARSTGLEMVQTGKSSDIEVMILNRNERLSLARKTRQAGAVAMAIDLENNLEGLVCAAYYFESEGNPELVDYTIIIPNELSGILRKSCIEEEFGQAFGPSADFDGARPSVFNDDEEFAFLTDHDEWLFRILYDPRLSDGMDLETAMPIVRQIVSEIRPNR